MAGGLANTLPAPSVAVVPRIEPHLVEVVLPFPLGAADQVIALAAEKIAELLAQPNLGVALASTPAVDDDSSRVATTEMVQQIKRALTEAAAAYTDQRVESLTSEPGNLFDQLPKTPPATPKTPWDNGGLFCLTPDA